MYLSSRVFSDKELVKGRLGNAISVSNPPWEKTKLNSKGAGNSMKAWPRRSVVGFWEDFKNSRRTEETLPTGFASYAAGEIHNVVLSPEGFGLFRQKANFCRTRHHFGSSNSLSVISFDKVPFAELCLVLPVSISLSFDVELLRLFISRRHAATGNDR